MGLVPRHIAQAARKFFPSGLWEGPEDRRWVALTFDDGPHPEITVRLLDALRRADAVGTFFTIGEHMRRFPDLVRRIHGEGHAVGNHTWGHRPLSVGCCVSPERQVGRTEELLVKLAPGSPRIFRPPFGAIGPGGAGVLKRHGLLPVYWSVVPADWDPLPPEEVRKRVLAEVHPGAVVVLHGGRGWHRGTAEALEALIADLREREYEIVPLGRMLAAAGHTIGTR